MNDNKCENMQRTREEENEVLLDAIEIIARRVWAKLKPVLRQLFEKGDVNENERAELPNRRTENLRENAE